MRELMLEFYRRNKDEIDRYLFVAAFLAIIYVFAALILPFVAPFCLAYLLSLAAEPFVRLLGKYVKVGRGVSAFLFLGLFVFLAAFVGGALISKIVREAYMFALALPRYLSDAVDAIDALKERFIDYSRIIPGDIDSYFADIGPRVVNMATSFAGELVKDGSVNLFSGIPNMLMNFLFFIISSFFFIKDRGLISRAATENSPQLLVTYYRVLKEGLFSALWGYLRAESVVISIISIINIVGLMLIDYPYALFMGLIIGFLDALPVLGSGFILWPWAALSFISGNYSRTVCLIVLYVVNLFTRQSVEPRLLSAQIGLHPVITLMSIYAGAKIFGPIGFLLGPVTAVSVKILLQALESKDETRSVSGQ